MKYTFDILPVAAPRMTSFDRNGKRPVVAKYFGFRNRLRYVANLQGLNTLPGEISSIIFYMPMPLSWSTRKREAMNGQPHTVRPDLDNLTKSILDGLSPNDDAYIHTIGKISKVWAEQGAIQLVIN